MCTGVRFSDEEGNMYFGRNLDWSFSYGESILATPRGANEHGLAIAGLNFPGYAEFVHEPVEGTDNVATFEFPLWVARNFDSVDEVEEALKNVTLVSQIVPGQQESLLHWRICATTCASATRWPSRPRGARRPCPLGARV